MPQVKFPPLMKYYVENQTEFSAQGANVSELFENIIIRYPALKPHLFDSKNNLRRHFQIFINGVHIRELDGMNTKLNENDKVILMASAAGG
jgi:molybdopterin converting factor small subunit